MSGATADPAEPRDSSNGVDGPDGVDGVDGVDAGEARPRERSPRRGMCAAVLFLEAITIALATPVMIVVNDVSAGVAVPVGLGTAVLCVLVSGALRAEWAYGVGWLLQVLAVAMGFLVSLMFFLGALFGLLWGTAYFLGRTIEREKAAAWAAWEREQGLGAPPGA